MRKLVMFNLVSVDGFFASPDGGIDWHNVDDEFNRAAVEMIERFDTIVFGRTTYELFEGYWPKAVDDPKVSAEDRVIARRIDAMAKVVYSRSLKGVAWRGAELRREIVPAEVEALKRAAGKDLVIYGSGTVVDRMTRLGLIDEYQFMVNPVVLGRGKTLFTEGPRKLKLAATRSFSGGNVLLTYLA